MVNWCNYPDYRCKHKRNLSCNGTRSNGCDASDTININVSPALTATVISTNDVTCYNGNNGTANITISGGESPFTLSWNDTITDVIALWTLDDTSGNLVIDHSGNGINATNQGATINQTGVYGRAYLFDGVDDIIEIQIIPKLISLKLLVDLTA